MGQNNTKYLHKHSNICREIIGCSSSKFSGMFYRESKEIKIITNYINLDRQVYKIPIILEEVKGEGGGASVVFDLFEKHSLIAGTTGSGKTTLTTAIALNLFFFNHGNYLKIIFLDGKGGGFNHSLENITNMATGIKDIYNYFILLDKLIDKRKKELKKRKELNVLDNNINGKEIIPYIVVFVDEWEEILRGLKNKEEEKAKGIAGKITRIGRSVGIFLIVCTQTPYVSKVGGELKNNMMIKICGRINHLNVKNTAITGDEFYNIMKLKKGEFLLEYEEGVKKIRNTYIPNAQITKIIERLQSFDYNYKLFK